jgi:hypothetical protein
MPIDARWTGVPTQGSPPVGAAWNRGVLHMFCDLHVALSHVIAPLVSGCSAEESVVASLCPEVVLRSRFRWG